MDKKPLIIIFVVLTGLCNYHKAYKSSPTTFYFLRKMKDIYTTTYILKLAIIPKALNMDKNLLLHKNAS